MSTVVVELREQLLAWERELESREGTVVAWEDGLVALMYPRKGAHGMQRRACLGRGYPTGLSGQDALLQPAASTPLTSIRF
jgi:hypothetical protein